jgi:(E)-4-hydroxy-3-methylbut-2-enyl-diphosphate synthase
MKEYSDSLTRWSRLKTLEVKVGDLVLGNFHPVRVQTMTTTDTMDTLATVEQSIRCIEAGAELVRITAPSKKEAENLLNIKQELRRRGYKTPLVADIHFTPNAAEIAARIVEKVRVNPGNYIDKKKFEVIEYSDAEYHEEIDRIRQRFTPLVRICKEYGTAMRIGTNHGSLSDRIMSRYGDTPMGMVESAMEFLRVARDESYHNIVLSMKSSNPQVMVQAYRLLIGMMDEEFGVCYPLHLGVTEAGDGEDGRIKSAIGIGTLMEDGIGDTIRVSLTEDPEFEIPVCKDLVNRYEEMVHRHKDRTSPREDRTPPHAQKPHHEVPPIVSLPYSPFEYRRRSSGSLVNIGGGHVPVVIADFGKSLAIGQRDLGTIGYDYNELNDKWNIRDAAADYLYVGDKAIDFELPGTLQVICDHKTWLASDNRDNCRPLFRGDAYGTVPATERSDTLNFVEVDAAAKNAVAIAESLRGDATAVVVCRSSHPYEMLSMRRWLIELMVRDITCPVILRIDSREDTSDKQLIHFSAEAGALLLDGMGDGLWLNHDTAAEPGFLNRTAFYILQATRTRISKTEYISCPSCGRTLFDLQETTARIRKVTHHLKGVKIAIMGCIVNGPGEMADADFGYVGSGPGKITLYKGKDIVKRGVDSAVAVDELIRLLKENNVWVEPAAFITQ